MWMFNKKLTVVLFLISGLFQLSSQTPKGEQEECTASASIDVPCPDGGGCHCEVKKVYSAVCEATTCSGGRVGCKCYGYCGGLIPRTSVCCCPRSGPRGEEKGETDRMIDSSDIRPAGPSKEEKSESKFVKIINLPKEELEISLEKYATFNSIFYFLTDPYKRFFVGVDVANHFLYINSTKIENAELWIKYLPENNQLFYLTKSSLKDTILEIRCLDLTTNKDISIGYIQQDPFLFSSPFCVLGNKIVLKNGNKVEIRSISKNKKISEFSFRMPKNIEVEYMWQNKEWFIGYTQNHVYLFFNSLPYVIIFDTLFNMLKSYDLSEYEGIKHILLKLDEEYKEIYKEKRICCFTYSISQCFTISSEKIIWIFGNLCFLLKNGEIIKEVIFKNEEYEELMNIKNIKIVPFYVSPISLNQIFLNFGNTFFTVIKGGI